MALTRDWHSQTSAHIEAPRTLKRSRRYWAQRLLALFVCGVALAPLLDPNARWVGDWENQQWISAYYHAAFRHHLQLPASLNTPQVIGLRNGIFYGDIFYGSVGLIATVLGVDGATRAVILLALLMQFFCVWRVVALLSGRRFWANTIAALVIWQLYPLTNLYSRGTIPEFVAVCFLTCAACTIVEIGLRGCGTNRWRVSLRLAFFLSCAASCHPITALFGGICLLILSLTCVLFSRKRAQLTWALTIGAVMVGLILAPWLYLLVGYRSSLSVSKDIPGADSHTASLWYLAHDTLWTRLAPFPWTYGVKLYPLPGTITPYLDAQTNVPLLLWLLAAVSVTAIARWRSGRQSILSPTSTRPQEVPVAVCVGMFGALLSAFCLWLSVDSHLPPGVVWVTREIAHIPQFVSSLQFAYRLVSYQNLGLILIAAVISWRGWRAGPRSLLLPAICWFTLGIAANAVALKVTEGRAMSNSSPFWRSELDALVVPNWFYAQKDYTVTTVPQAEVSRLRTARQRLDLKVAAGSRFGEVLPHAFHLESPALVTTNVAVFPWNKVYLNGKPASAAQVFRDGYLTALTLAPGDYRIEFRSQADPSWLRLRRISWFAFGSLIATGMFQSISWRLHRRRRISRRHTQHASRALIGGSPH
jgi:hypothetical protein